VLATKPPHELLIILGGVLAILLSAVAFAIRWTEGIPLSAANPVVRTFVLTMVLGGVLVMAGAIARKNIWNGAIVAVVVSVVLIVYGGQEGTIGGFVGLIGSGIAVASPYLHRK
jgi:hypothetical protein